MKQLMLTLCLMTAGLLMVQDAHAGKYDIDAVHSSATFKIRHFLSKVTGRFTKFSGTIEFDAKQPKKSKVNVSIEAASINTDNAKRDNHLRSKDFFETSKYGKITFVSTKVTGVKRKGKQIHMTVHGNLTIKDKTHSVKLQTVFMGEMNLGKMGTRAGFSATVSIDRHKFGVTTGKKMLRMALGADVAIDINVEAVKQK